MCCKPQVATKVLGDGPDAVSGKTVASGEGTEGVTVQASETGRRAYPQIAVPVFIKSGNRGVQVAVVCVNACELALAVLD